MLTLSFIIYSLSITLKLCLDILKLRFLTFQTLHPQRNVNSQPLKKKSLCTIPSYDNVNILLLDTQLPHSTLFNSVLNNSLQVFLLFFTLDDMTIIAENTNLNIETQDATEK